MKRVHFDLHMMERVQNRDITGRLVPNPNYVPLPAGMSVGQTDLNKAFMEGHLQPSFQPNAHPKQPWTQSIHPLPPIAPAHTKTLAPLVTETNPRRLHSSTYHQHRMTYPLDFPQSPTSPHPHNPQTVPTRLSPTAQFLLSRQQHQPPSTYHPPPRAPAEVATCERRGGNTTSYIMCVIRRLRDMNMEPSAIYMGKYYTTIKCRLNSLNCSMYVVVVSITCDTNRYDKIRHVEEATRVATKEVLTSSAIPPNTKIDRVMYNNSSFQIVFATKSYGCSINTLDTLPDNTPFLYAPGIIYTAINNIPDAYTTLQGKLVWTLSYIVDRLKIAQKYNGAATVSGYLTDIRRHKKMDWLGFEKICRSLGNM